MSICEQGNDSSDHQEEHRDQLDVVTHLDSHLGWHGPIIITRETQQNESDSTHNDNIIR
jgi:hypothetical protein